MFKAKLLFSVLVVSGTNLFAVKVKDLINCLTPERRDQVEASGYDLINSRFAAVRFVIEQFPLLSREHMRDLREYVGQLFADGRQIVNESDIYDVIDKFAKDKEIEVIRPMDSSSLDVAAPGAAAASMITFSLTQCMSAEEAERVGDQRGYYRGQLNEALSRFLEKNATCFSEEKIRAIKKEFNDRYFKGATSGKHIAPVGAVDADFTRLVDDIKLSIDTIVIPKIEYCIICKTDIEDTAEIECCPTGHPFHKECIVPALAIKPNECPTCQAPFNINLEDWFMYAGSNREQAIGFCIKAGADIDRLNEAGYSALMLACFLGYDKMATLLIENGANPNAVAPYGDSILILAARHGLVRVVDALIKKGVDKEVVNSNGHTALYEASFFEHDEVVELLRAHAARE